MRNKLFSLVMIFLMIVFFTGCSNATKTVEESPKEELSEEKDIEQIAEKDIQEAEIEEINSSPVAIINYDKDIAGINEVFNLDCTKSNDPDGDELSYEWILPDGDKETKNTIRISFDEFGEYEVSLTVSDGELDDTESIKLIVENQAPIAEANQYFYDVKVGDTVILSAEPSSDPEGDELTYEWTLPDGSVLEGLEVEYVPQEGGTFSIELVVSDGDKSDQKIIELEVYEPIIFSGSGDSIVNIEKENIAMAVHIKGNSSSRHFAIKSYDINGEYIELLVNTTDPYDGICPLDFMSGEWTTRFEVTASGSWSIELVPLTSLRVLTIPGTIEGNGDEVFMLNGGTPDTAKIIGNSSSSHFAVKSYGDDRDLLVNTTEPYDGEVLLDSSAVIIEVISESSWSIEIFER